MRFFLPRLRRAPIAFYLKEDPTTRAMRQSVVKLETLWSFFTVSIATIFLLLFFVFSYQKVYNVLSPIVSSFTSVAFAKDSYEVFTFAPGWSSKLDKIDYDGLDILAYFDAPVSKDGTLDRENDGYYTLKSQEAKDLFYKAHLNSAKVLITLSQTYKDDILALLESPHAQQTLITQAIAEVMEAEIDGVAIDFEYNGTTNSFYKEAFTHLVKNMTREMHQAIPGSIVSVTLGNTHQSDSIYDFAALGSVADKVFIMAYSIAVPEVKNAKFTSPIFGFDGNSYEKQFAKHIETFARYIPEDKFALERAWYGNGDDYPFYQSEKRGTIERSNQNTLSTPLSRGVIKRLVSSVPIESRAAVLKNLPFIAKALEEEGLLNPNVLAYTLATIEHETAGTFEPIAEFKGTKSARRLGYEGGTAYFGRGFIQLTHLRNYKKFGERIGVGDRLVQHPELASDPEIAAKVLAAFFKDNNVGYLATQGEFVRARVPVNPDQQGWWIATLAWNYVVQI